LAILAPALPEASFDSFQTQTISHFTRQRPIVTSDAAKRAPAGASLPQKRPAAQGFSALAV
jgi:hypothetical protein